MKKIPYFHTEGLTLCGSMAGMSQPDTTAWRWIFFTLAAFLGILMLLAWIRAGV
jgi:hypothetical protein